jgi:hypothetical protein
MQNTVDHTNVNELADMVGVTPDDARTNVKSGAEVLTSQ